MRATVSLVLQVIRLQGSMLQGFSNYALDGYLNAIQDSQAYEWE